MERTTTKQTDMKFAKCINKGEDEYLTIGNRYSRRKKKEKSSLLILIQTLILSTIILIRIFDVSVFSQLYIIYLIDLIYYKNSIGMKLLSFTINGNVYTIVISDDGIKYSKDFDHQLNGINQQVINYIISEERNSKLNQLGI